MMRALTEIEFEREARPALSQVFEGADPFGQPFAPTVLYRLILYPVHYTPDARLLRHVVRAASHTGDNAFYLSIFERPPADEQDRPYHWHVPFGDVGEYRRLTYAFVLENAIYSPHGRWGIMFSHEGHALLGGSGEWVDSLRRALPEARDGHARFLKEWRRRHERWGSDIPWVPPLMTHMYGAEVADRLCASPE